MYADMECFNPGTNGGNCGSWWWKGCLLYTSLVIGSKRVLNCFDLTGKKIKYAINSDEIKNIIDENTDTKISVVFSGDIGFYSGAKKLVSILD